MVSTEALVALLEACGASGPVELEVEDSRTQTVVRRAFHQPFLVAGRGAPADLILSAPEVSRRHAYLQVVAGQIFCFDLGSRTGTRWQHGPRRSGWLDQTRGVAIGPFTLRLAGGIPASRPAPAGDWDPLTSSSPEQARLPKVHLESVDSSGKRVSWRMNRGLALVGHSGECKVRVRDAAVSRFSCSLVRTPAGTWVIDLLGRPGVTVNNRRVRWALLHEGDQLRVGAVSLRVKYERGEEAYSAVVSNPPAADPPGPHGADGFFPALPNLPLDKDLAPERTPLLAAAGQLVPTSPLVAHLPAGAVDKEAVTALLLPLAGQFALMQQQMFEQFTQALVVMSQVFGQLQRDQLGQIREELERLHQLSRDLQALQRELAQSGPAAGRPPGEAAPLSPAQPRIAPPQPARIDTPSGAAVPTPPTACSAAVAGGNGSGASATPQAPPPAKQQEPPAIPRTAGSPTDPDIHGLLFQRIQDLQRERESSWQKLLNSLMGRQSGESSS